MLHKTFFALWFLSFTSYAYGSDSTICLINGIFVIGDACIKVSATQPPPSNSPTSTLRTTSSSSLPSVPLTPIASSASKVETTSSSSSTASATPFTTSSAPSSTSQKTSSSSSSSSRPSSSTTANTPGSTLPTIGNAPKPKGSGFQMTKIYRGEDFVTEWDYFSSPDPTHGTVQYVDQNDALSLGLVQVQNNVTTIKVDDTTKLSVGQQRKSVRISSQARVTGGLVVANLTAMPTGCSTWPAFWFVGDNWPKNGEVDAIEGVNRQTQNQMTLHTLPGCTRDLNVKPAPEQSVAFSGTPLQDTCDVTVNSNSGCGIMSTKANSYGAGFNQNGGGAIAMMWDQLGIRIWVYPQGTIPQDLIDRNPTPINWSAPDAFWSAVTCPVDKYFANMMIVFDTTLCGDFAGALFPSSGCPGTCAETVADPSNFQDAKWIINDVAIYK